MRTAYDVTHEGARLRIVLPDWLPSRLEELRREVEFECREPMTEATIVARHVRALADAHEPHRLVQGFERSGADLFVEWRAN